MPCLEIANQPIPPDGWEKYGKQMDRSLEIIADAPRLDTLYNGSSKDGKLWYFVQQWQSLEAHRTWQKFPVYSELMDLLNKVRDMNRKSVSRHVQTEADMPDCPVHHIMVVTGWKTYPDKHEEATAFAKKYCALTRSVYGWELEDPSYMYMVTTWQDLDQRKAFHNSETFKTITPFEEEFSEICEVQFKTMKRLL